MNNPGLFNFPDHYNGDRLIPFSIILKYKNGDPVELVGSEVKMQMRKIDGVLIWEFSSLLSGEKQLTVLPGGILKFPEIVSWSVGRAKTYYDLQVKKPNGDVQTFLVGSWRINQDTTI